jgi:hypothetical protein
MYTGCSGATYVYACCIPDRVCICGKICYFGFGRHKKGTSSLHREMEGHLSKLHGVKQNLL